MNATGTRAATPTAFLSAFAFTVAVAGDELAPAQIELVKTRLKEIFGQTAEAAEQISKNGERNGFFEEKPVLRLISRLTSGADRLAAREAFAYGFALRVVLPFPLASAEEFSGEELESLCAEAESVLQLNPLPPKAWRSRFERFSARDELKRFLRDRACLEAGDAMLKQADLLVAVWSGEIQTAPGATYDVICRALRSGTPICVISNDARIRVWQTWNQFEADDPTPPISIRELIIKNWGLDQGDLAARLADAKKSLPRIVGKKTPLMATLWNKFQKLISGRATKNLDPGPYRPDTDPVFKLFDAAANYYAALHRSSFLWLALLSALAVLCAALSAVWPAGPLRHAVTAALALGQLLFLTCSLVSLRKLRKKRLQNKLTNFRFLAEIMRLTGFCAPLGLSVRQHAVGSSFYGENEAWLEYIGRNHIRLRTVPSLNLADKTQFAAVKNDVEKYLIESQACYQNIVRARSKSMAAFLGLIFSSLIYLTILVVVVRFAGAFIFNLSLLIAGAAFVGTMGPVLAYQSYSIMQNAELRRMESRSAHLAGELETLLAEIRRADTGEELRSVTARTVALLTRDVKDWKDQYNIPKK